MEKPNPTNGLRHVAFCVTHFDACIHFYHKLIGMKIVWQPDDDNIYLSTDHDNLALHRAKENFKAEANQRLDHIGFFLSTSADVDHWHDFFIANHVEIIAAPKNHRDGTRSFYCKDPDGNVVQMIYYPVEA